MKKTGLLALMLTMVLSVLAPALEANAASKFTDVPKDFWAANEIGKFSELGVIKGYGDGKFQPNKPVTRGEAAVMLTRALELDTKNVGDVDYKDVDKKHQYYKEIAAVTNAGYMQGQPNGNFQSQKPLQRAHMAVLLANAFDLETDQKANFKDVSKDFYAADEINAIYAHNITTGFENNTFRPQAPTTRAQFVTFLDRALNPKEDLTALLKEVYANEMELKSYEFTGSANIGLTLPESFFDMPELDPELAEELEGMEDVDFEAIAAMLSDIQVDINGTYQKDPMQLEADIKVTIPGEMGFNMTMPMIMNETKMWIKFPESPLFPMPEEIAGKYIEFDLEALAELEGMEGQPPVNMDMELQTELAAAIYDLFFDHFGKDFYSEVSANSIKIPSGVDAKTVVKFELTNDNLQSFMEILFKGFLPGFLELIDNPEYAEAMGLTVEDIQMIKEELEFVAEDIDMIVKEINSILDIKKLEEHIVITKDNYIGYDLTDIDLGINLDGEELGIKLKADSTKSKVNEDVKFKHGIPSGDNVITFEELMELELDLEEEAA